MMEQSLRASPMFFGSPERQLFGLLHCGAAARSTRAAVLLCRPFGQEAIRAHRAFRVVAERLARAGQPALRFDYFGTGDADGNDDQVTLAGLCADIETANEHLRLASSNRPIAWLGLGLGATAAWLTAARAVQPPQYLLLWDPILDGRDYLATLCRRHSQLLDESLAIGARRIPRATDVVEANGFSISRGFEAELAALTIDTMPKLPPGVHGSILASPEASGRIVELTRTRSSAAQLRHFELSREMDWMAEDSDDGVLVPAKALQKLLVLAGECE